MTTYTVTLSERFWARTEVDASTIEEAQAKATAKFHDDCFRSLEICEGASEFLEFAGPDFFETEAEPATNESPSHGQ